MAPVPTATGGGSGCSPGAGELPDGVWFGFIDGIREESVDFDLACVVSCEHGEGLAIRNDSGTLRTVDVHPGAIVITPNPDGDDWLDSFAAYASYEEVGLHTGVWIHVNDGAITHVAAVGGSGGCRSAAVDVEWTAEVPGAAGVAFNDLGLITLSIDGSGDRRFHWRSDGWTRSDPLPPSDEDGWGRWMVAAAGDSVAYGATIGQWSGSAWSAQSFDGLGDDVRVLGMSDDRVLMAGTSGGDAEAYVLTRSGDSWVGATITIGPADEWQTWSGAISATTFAVADTGLETVNGRGTVHVYDFDGARWHRTATIEDPLEPAWVGNWGSSLDMDGDLLVVGADGATPGSGTPGAVYAYARIGGSWEEEIVGQGGEGFGLATHIDGNTIITSASHADRDATFWIFTVADPGWVGTPIHLEAAGEDDWVYAIDMHDDLVAVSLRSGTRIGRLIPVG